MKKQHLTYLLLGLFITFGITSCKKDEEEVEQITGSEQVISFAIDNPVAFNTYGLADTVHIDMMLSADIEFHGFSASIYNVTADSTVWSIDEHDHGMMFHVHDYWVNDVTAHSDMELRVTGFVDHDGVTEEETVMFHCHPM